MEKCEIQHVIENVCENECVDDFDVSMTTEVDVKKDPSYECEAVDYALKVEKVKNFLTECGEPTIKIKRCNVSAAEKKKLIILY